MSLLQKIEELSRQMVRGCTKVTPGGVTLFTPDGVASYDALWLRDLIPEEPSEYPKAIEVGVLGAMVGQVGALESSEAIKLLAGFGEPLVGRVMVMDAAAGRWGVVPLRSRRC